MYVYIYLWGIENERQTNSLLKFKIMKTTEGLQACAKIKSIQPIIEGLLLNANRDGEHFKSFRDIKTFLEIISDRITEVETLIVNLDSKASNLDSKISNLYSNLNK